jgi:alpha-glucoside transport system substrate-binding protein
MNGRRVGVRRRSLLVVPLLLAVVAAACTNKPAKSAGGSQGGAKPSGPYKYLANAEAGKYRGKTVEILGQWVEAEKDNFEASLKPFIDRTGIDVQYEGITDYETVLNVRVQGDNAPDLAQLAQPGLMRQFQTQGKLVDLSKFINVSQLKKDFIQSFLDLATVNGHIYGVYYKADLKSIVWYPVKAFEDKGYQIPQTWDEMLALSDQIKAAGSTPWCISIEHGDASGWVATDWIEDVLLRTAPLDTYDKWVSHDIPFNDPAVLHAADMVKQIWFTPGYVFGGNKGINNTFVGDTQSPMFDKAGPKCWLHKQAAWIPSFWPTDPKTDKPLYTPGVDSSFFYLPPIDPQYGKPVLGAGDMFVAFHDRPEVRAVMEYLATAESAHAWITAGGFVSPNESVPQDWYTTYPSSGLGEILANASALRFDASDQMPAEVGQGTFWSGMVKWVSANGANTEQIFQDIEDSWPSG